MPELPEVETIRQDLREVILGKMIAHVDVRRESMVRGDAVEFAAYLAGNEIIEIDRIGKLLIFQLKKGEQVMLGHLKMTGQLIYKSPESLIAGGHTEPPVDIDLPNKFSYIIFTFADGTKLFFNDMRTFGYMSLEDQYTLESIKKKYGIEPGTKAFTLDAWKNVFKNRKTSVKAVLLNQALISGIGNIYADEICFHANVLPSKQVSKLGKKEIEQLFYSTKHIILLAVKERGTTFNHYRDPKGRKGNFVSFLNVYGRGGEQCNVCRTALTKEKIAGRGTVYCSCCQM